MNGNTQTNTHIHTHTYTHTHTHTGVFQHTGISQSFSARTDLYPNRGRYSSVLYEVCMRRARREKGRWTFTIRDNTYQPE